MPLPPEDARHAVPEPLDLLRQPTILSVPAARLRCRLPEDFVPDLAIRDLRNSLRRRHVGRLAVAGPGRPALPYVASAQAGGVGARARDRPTRAAARGEGRRLAAGHPPAPRAVEPRGPHGEARRRSPAVARHRGSNRSREDRRRRRAARRQVPGRSSRCARTWTRFRSPKRSMCRSSRRCSIDVQRTGRRRHARVRSRRARRDPDGRRRAARRHEASSCRGR